MLESARSSATRFLNERLPVSLRETARLRLFGLLKIPLVFFVSPKVIALDDRHCIVEIPLRRRTRNHFRSMYFGVLAIGADLGAGLLAQSLIESRQRSGARREAGILFKDFQAKFLKRAEGDTRFICDEGEKIGKAIDQAMLSGERQNIPVRVYAQVLSRSESETVAEFTLTLSLKVKPSNPK